MTYLIWPLLASFLQFGAVSLGATGEALATGQDLAPVLEVDLSLPIRCQMTYGRRPERVVIGEFLDGYKRLVRLVGVQVGRDESVVADCQFEEENYICRWDKNFYVQVSLAQPRRRELSYRQFQNSLRGKARVRMMGREEEVFCYPEKIRMH